MGTRPRVREAAVSVFLAAATLVVALGCSGQPRPIEPMRAELTAAYIVQGDEAASLVRQVGGRVTHELPIINAVGAELTAGQRTALLDLDEDLRVFEDRDVDLKSVEAGTVQ